MLADTIKGLGDVYAAQEDVDRRQHWPEAAHQAKAAFPCSACGSTAACISQQCHNATASVFKRLSCASNAAWQVKRFGTTRRQGRWQSVLPASTALPMSTKVSIRFSSQSIPAWFSLAAAEGSALEGQLIGCLFGYDQALFDLARTLALESAADYPNGPLFWNGAASDFIDNLLARHTSKAESRPRGMLGNTVLKRLKDYIVAHLDEPIEVAVLADIAGRCPFHFTRVFTRSVGLTPHRYVLHLRVQRATELVRHGQVGLAEIAARTGFADQSHLSRWVRRVHGVPLTRLVS